MSNPYDPYSSYDPYQQPQPQQPNTYQQYSPEGSGAYNPYQPPQENYQQQQYSQPASAAYPPYNQQPVMVNIQQQVGQQQAMVQPVLVAMPIRQTNGKATAAMVLGLCTFLTWFLTGIPAVILGHMALGEINRSNGTQDGRGQAITGLVLGYLSIASLVGVCLYFIFVIGLLSSAAAGAGG